MGILKLHPENINQLKGHIINIGPAIIHGDGNIYPAPPKDWTPNSGVMNHSYNNAVFSNPKREEAQYFKQYNTVSEVPKNVDDLERELIASKLSAKARVDQPAATVSKTFEAYKEPEKKGAAPAKEPGEGKKEPEKKGAAPAKEPGEDA
jgi:hypothetical protein